MTRMRISIRALIVGIFGRFDASPGCALARLGAPRSALTVGMLIFAGMTIAYAPRWLAG